MKQNIEKRIIGILKEKKGLNLDASALSKEVGLTYDTVSSYLKRMVDNGILERKGIGAGNVGSHWRYYYCLKGDYQ